MIIVVVLSLLIGVSLGLLGGGGSVLAVPVLKYVAGLEAKEAIATSLLVVATTAFFAMLQHALKNNVDWRVGALFAVTAMVGAYLGGAAAAWFSGQTLLLLFSAMMVATAVFMFRGRKELKSERKTIPHVLVVIEGVAVGGATGLVGAGGGFLVVPALVLLGGMDMHRAVGTSLFVIALKSVAGFAGHASHVSIDYELAASVSVAAVVGSVAGSSVANKVPAAALRRGFSFFVLLMAGFVIWQEVVR